MSSTNTPDELDHLLRALSHDMNANFMLLEHSFSQLKRLLHSEVLRTSTAQDAAAPDALDGRVEHVDACLRQSKRLLDDLVQLGQTGRVDMEPGRVALAAVVDEVLFEQRELLGTRGIHVKVAQSLPEVWCNEERVKQIVTNLIRNAVRHGCDASGPWIAITPHVDPLLDHLGLSAFEVVDNGSGIDPNDAEEIFLPGKRLASACEEGSGMGLAIVRKIVDYYGGHVRIDTQRSLGTAFVVALPKAYASTQQSNAAYDLGRRWKLQLQGHHDDPAGHVTGRQPLSLPHGD